MIDLFFDVIGQWLCGNCGKTIRKNQRRCKNCLCFLMDDLPSHSTADGSRK